MKIGVVGLDAAGCIIAGHLLAKTAHDICTYDPDGRRCGTIVRCDTAAELFDQCERIVIALAAPAELTALCNAVSAYWPDYNRFDGHIACLGAFHSK